MLTENQIKEQISIAYVHAVASKVGVAFETCSIDMDSIDAVIRENGFVDKELPTLYSPEIKLQLKSSTVVKDDG